MRRTGWLGLIVMLSTASYVAGSSPGQPLDCSDWVWLVPGYSCHSVPAVPTCNPTCPSDLAVQGADEIHVAADGQKFAFERIPLGGCGSASNWLSRIRLVGFDGTNTRVIGYVDERCVAPATLRADTIRVGTAGATFGIQRSNLDLVRGVASTWLLSKCIENLGDMTQDCSGAPSLSALTEFTGFTPLLEIVPTYAPAAPWSFRVPALPEGMPAADHFDTYWGQIANPIDLAQAHSLQCGYPATPPHAGDFIQVADSLVPPPVGTGYWYLTTVTHDGETRAGRRAMNGELHGRDASVLPACVPPAD